MSPIRTAAALLALTTLAACGLKGGLETPPPAWGEARRAYEADLRAKAEAAEKAKADEKAKERPTITLPQTSPTSPPPAAPK